METREQEKIREAVRNRYAKVATGSSGATDGDKSIADGCCGSSVSPATSQSVGCGCGNSRQTDALAMDKLEALLGYSAESLVSAPEGANMGLGCGNPVALASLRKGETVVDLGSGGGFDCFLAAQRVGADGRVIGVDMTPEMVAKARHNAEKANAANVEFRLGEIEHLPVADNSVDLILSNCVINLSVDKAQVFREAYRVLKPGGRLSISDILATQPLPPEVREDLALVSACVGGAATLDDTRALLARAGFEEIRIDANEKSREVIESCASGSAAGDYVTSAYVRAVKPG